MLIRAEHSAAPPASPGRSGIGSSATIAWRLHLPNVLTVLRLLFAALFFLALEIARRPIHDEVALLTAAGLFCLAALTDVIDGPLARRWNAVSAFGRIMDPVADKVLVVGAFVYLAGPAFLTTIQTTRGIRHVQASGVDPWMVVVILARELLVTSLRGWIESRGIDFSATIWGKAKMIAQSAAVPAVLVLVSIGSNLSRERADPYELPRPEFPDWVVWSIRLVVWTTVAITAVSAIPYVTRSLALMANRTRAQRDRMDRPEPE